MYTFFLYFIREAIFKFNQEYTKQNKYNVFLIKKFMLT